MISKAVIFLAFMALAMFLVRATVGIDHWGQYVMVGVLYSVISFFMDRWLKQRTNEADR